MSDFCKQCSEELFDEDFEDLAGLCKVGEMVVALCEGCGSIWVNHEGECQGDCLNPNHGRKQ